MDYRQKIIELISKCSDNELLELVTSIVDMNYFYFEQFLLDLLEDNYIFTYKKDSTVSVDYLAFVDEYLKR